jgi:hypothetical protein
MKKAIKLLSAIMIFSLILNGQEHNQTADSKREVLNGHTFQSLSHFKTSFISTHLKANIGFGSTPVLKIKGIFIDEIEILAFEGKVAFVDVGVQYQQRFTPWLAMYLNGTMAGRIGTDLSTIVADGVNTLTGFRIGWLIRIKQSKKLNLSANIHVSNVTGNFMNVSQYIDDLINENPNASLTKKVPTMVFDIGLHGAYAFNPTWGIQFFGDFAYGESFERGRSQGYYSIGISGEVDFKPKYNIPVGLVLGYVTTTDPESISADSGRSNIFLGKIGYSASKEFELGLQFSYFDVNLRSVEQETYVSKAMLMLKFFF